MNSTVKESWFQGRDGRQARRASLGEVGGSMCGGVGAKALQEDM